MKIRVILCYFGKFPNYFNLFLRSCENNPQIDWLIISDDQRFSSSSANIRFIYSSFQEVVNSIHKKLDPAFVCKTPYKLCDYKPAYGILFEEYLQEYDYWGHCDCDVIFGRLEKFLTEPLEKGYEKILPYGHLTLYKNTQAINNRIKQEFGGISYKYIYSHHTNFGFDEKRGVNRLYREMGYSYWDVGSVLLDVKLPIVSPRISFCNIPDNPKQLVYYLDQSVVCAYPDQGNVVVKEYAYVHLQKRRFKDNQIGGDKDFVILPCEFIEVGQMDKTHFDEWGDLPYEFMDSCKRDRSQIWRYRYHSLVNWLFHGKKPLR